MKQPRKEVMINNLLCFTNRNSSPEAVEDVGKVFQVWLGRDDNARCFVNQRFDRGSRQHHSLRSGLVLFAVGWGCRWLQDLWIFGIEEQNGQNVNVWSQRCWLVFRNAQIILGESYWPLFILKEEIDICLHKFGWVGRKCGILCDFCAATDLTRYYIPKDILVHANPSFLQPLCNYVRFVSHWVMSSP